MSTIPTIATRKMFKGLTFWDNKKMERWKNGLMVKIGIGLWKLGYSSTEYDDFMGKNSCDFQIETSLPSEDIVRFEEDSIYNMKVKVPIVIEGSRSFWVGLAYILDERSNQEIENAKKDIMKEIVKERDEEISKLKKTINNLQDRILKDEFELSEISEIVHSMDDNKSIDGLQDLDTWKKLVEKTSPHFEDQF